MIIKTNYENDKLTATTRKNRNRVKKAKKKIKSFQKPQPILLKEYKLDFQL